jgi:hypothetical protein
MFYSEADLIARVHHIFIDSLRTHGRAPSRAQAASELCLPIQAIDAALARLEAAHGVVLHPNDREPWVIHPFSISPTATWVEQGVLGWWAPCLWCAFGVVELIGGTAKVYARLGGEREPLEIDVDDGCVRQKDLVVHFSIPPRDAWNNVHHFCATILPFRSEKDVDQWCLRHGISTGAAVPIRKVATLGRVWYAHHCDNNWRKWTGAEAGTIFDTAGLAESFWQFDRNSQSF